MAYYTYFNGKLDIELKEPHLTILQTDISQNFENSKVEIKVDEHSFTVEGDISNGNGIIEEIVLFIQQYGVLKSGTIRCDGEEQNDIWEIVISDSKPIVNEIGKVTTLSRAERNVNLQKII